MSSTFVFLGQNGTGFTVGTRQGRDADDIIWVGNLDEEKNLIWEHLCALFYSTQHCPSQLGTIHKVIQSSGKTLFLDLKAGKRHIGQKNNSKQLLFYWCYTHFLIWIFQNFLKFLGLVPERRFLGLLGAFFAEGEFCRHFFPPTF